MRAYLGWPLENWVQKSRFAHTGTREQISLNADVEMRYSLAGNMWRAGFLDCGTVISHSVN